MMTEPFPVGTPIRTEHVVPSTGVIEKVQRDATDAEHWRYLVRWGTGTSGWWGGGEDSRVARWVAAAAARPAVAVDLPAPSVPGEGQWSWDSQARQYPRTGKPGITYLRSKTTVAQLVGRRTDRNIDVAATIDTLLHYSATGKLNGILCHYPDRLAVTFALDEIVLEEAGNVSMWVDPRRRRRGIGLALLAAADDRWHPDWSTQTYTVAGHALITRYLRRRSGC